MLYSPSVQRLSPRVSPCVPVCREKHSQATYAVKVRSLGALAVINVTDNGVGGASLTVATGWPTGCAAWMAP